MLNFSFEPKHIVTAMLAVAVAWISYNKLHQAFRMPKNRPLQVPYLIPWLGSGYSYARNPTKFLSSQRKVYGDCFRVYMAGRKITFVTSPSLVMQVANNTKDFGFGSIRSQVLHDVFGLSEQAAADPFIPEVLYSTFSRNISKQRMTDSMTSFGTQLLFELSALISSDKVKGCNNASLSLWDIVFRSSYIAHNHATFGPHFPSTKLFSDYDAFDEAFAALASRLPSFLTRRYHNIRARLLSEINKFIHVRWSDEHLILDGSSSNIGEIALLLKSHGVEDQDISAHFLSFFWGTQSNTSWAIFWFVAHIIQSEQSLHLVRQEVDGFVESFNGDLQAAIAADPSMLDGNYMPALEAAFRETIRLCSVFTFARSALQPTTLRPAYGEPIHILENDLVFAIPRLIHMDPKIYDKRDIYDIGHFLSEDGKKLRTTARGNGKPIYNSYFPWGGGEIICKGRFVAAHEFKIFAVILFRLYSIYPEFVSKRGRNSALKGLNLPRSTESSLGIQRSNEDLFIRLVPRSCV